MNKKWIAAIVVYLGLIAVCCIVLYAVPSVRGMLERTYIAEYGRIDVTDEVSAFIVRDDAVYTAAGPSVINRLAEADKLVMGGTRVVELRRDRKAEEKQANGSDIRNSVSKYFGIMEELGDIVIPVEEGYSKTEGYVSYYVDGAEAKFSTSTLDSLTYEDYKSLEGRKAMETPDRKCAEGEPVFKITRNGKWYLVYYLGNGSAGKYEPGTEVTVSINGKSMPATVSQVLTGEKYSKITLSCKEYFNGFLESRNVDATVTVASAEGLILEDNSIVDSPDGKRGVFVKNKLGEHIFKPVRVKADDGVKCVAYSDIYVDDEGNYVETIGTYDEIVAEPTEEDMADLARAVEQAQQEAAEAEAAAEKAKKEAEAKAKEEAAAKAEAAAESAKDGEAPADAANADTATNTDNTENSESNGDQG